MIFNTTTNKYGLTQAQQYDLYVKIYGLQINKLVENIIKTSFNLSEIPYAMLRDYFRYDKRIRKVIYKYIEIYEDNLKSIFYDQTIWENNLFVLATPGENYSSIYEINKIGKNYYSLGRLKEILFSLKLIKETKSAEIDKVIELRNNIAHFNLLILHLDELKKLIDGFVSSLPKPIIKQFLQDINFCKKGLTDLQTLYLDNY